MEGMKEHKAFVLVGETGSGKTTQVSPFYLQCSYLEKTTYCSRKQVVVLHVDFSYESEFV